MRRTLTSLTILLPLALGLPLQPQSAHAQEAGAVVERQRAVEAGLLPAVLITGEPEPSYSIYERMEHYGVPGVSIAVINDGQIEWAEGYGVKRIGGADSVVPGTLFQAASISKPVAATAALQLVEEGLLDLDAAINSHLTSWQIPENDFTDELPVTLRGILTHSAGLTIHGFPGYGPGEAVPTTVGVLDGAGNTDPVVVDTFPGSLFRYSGGGYTIAEVAMEDVTGDDFAAVMDRLVLDPFGMRASTYEQPLPERLADVAAVAHRGDGTTVDGRWHTYPEQAAAGLWTTPSDLARYALGIRTAYLGEPGAILDQATAREMLEEHMGGWGIGLSVAGEGDGFRFSHGGANAGYRAYFVLYPATGDGVAVMTNSDSGNPLYMEVIRAVSRVYGWPDYQPETLTVVDLAPAILADYVGRYELEPGNVLTISLEGEQLFASAPGLGKLLLRAQSETDFFPEGNQFSLTFVRSAEGDVSHLILHVGGTDMEVRRVGS